MKNTWMLTLLLGCSPGGGAIDDGDVGADTDAVDTDDTDTDAVDTDDTDTEILTTDTSDTATTAAVTDAPDYRLPGPYTVRTGGGTAQGSCALPYDTWIPEGTTPVAVVVLSHGFARSKAQVAGWAEHWASWGLAVATPDMCALGALSVDHDIAWRDLVTVADAVAGSEPLLYAGHSAGGLASFLATADDPRAVGHLGLDPVDNDGRAAAAAGSVTVPSHHLLADASACNEQANWAPVLSGLSNGRALRIPGSDHCDFESPTDFLCTAFCTGGGASDAVVRDTILPLSTAFLLWQAGDPVAEQWWTPGSGWYDQLATYAGIQEL